MNIGEMFVRLSADTSGFKRDMAGAERSMDQFGKTSVAVERQSERAKLGVGRLGNQFGSLISSMAGVHPVATNVVGVLGNFAIGAGAMTGVLLGVAALTKVWTEFRREGVESKKVIDDIVKSLYDQAQAAKVATAAGQDHLATVALANEFLAERNLQRTKDGGGPWDPFGFKKRRIGKAQSALDVARSARGQADFNALEIRGVLPGKAKKGGRNTLGMPDVSGSVNATMDAYFANRTSPQDWLKGRIEGQATAPFQMSPMQPILSQLERDAKYGREIPPKLDGIGDKMKQGLMDMSGSLIQGLAGVAQAMLLGGKGRGSQIGGGLLGAIGGGIGKIVGIGGGPIGSVIGAAVGTVAGTVVGSVLGGLFDKKKKVANGLDMMASGLARVNQQLRNMPSGYKVRRQQYGATDVGDDNGWAPHTPPVGGGGGSGGGGKLFTIQNLTVMANSPTALVREMERAVASAGTRGGPSRLAAVY